MKGKLFTVIQIFLIILLVILLVREIRISKGIGSTQNSTSVKELPYVSNYISENFKKNKPFSILLLGYGGENHFGTYLTDTIMLIRIDPVSKIISLISIPRDTYLDIPVEKNSSITGKINSFYAIGINETEYPDKNPEFKGHDGGGNLMKYAVNTVTGITPERYAAIDFDGFKKIIDILGGVTVKVEKAFDDYVYPIDGKEDDVCTENGKIIIPYANFSSLDDLPFVYPCRYEHIHFDEGETYLDGNIALKFVRSRHSEQDGSDFGRSARQKNLLIAVKDKLLSVRSVPQIISLIKTFGSMIKTDLTFDELISLYNIASDSDSYYIQTIALNDANVLFSAFSFDGQYILRPRSYANGFDFVHTWISEELKKKPEPPTPLVYIINGTDIYGLEKTASERLKKLSVNSETGNIIPIRNAIKTSIILLDNKMEPLAKKIIEEEFGTKTVRNDNFQSKSKFSAFIILGDDYGKLINKPFTPVPIPLGGTVISNPFF